MLRILIAALALVCMLGSARAEIGPPIRFGLTSVVVQENLRFLDRWAEHLSAKIGRPVEFVRRRSYREITDLLESGGLEFAWICGYPFIQKRDPEFLTLLAVPVYRGEPLYHSFIIVHRDSPHSKLEDLRGGVFSFSDPESNSGFLYPQSVLAAQGETPESFFRQTFFTFNHAETIEAVAEQVADGGAVDSYIWEYLRTYRPELTEKTRVIMRSPKFGFPPLVSRLGVDASIVSRMKTALAEMESDPEGRKFLDGLKLDRFGDFSPSLFDNIRRMADETRQSLPWLASKTKNKKY